jgi:hypothetical protein
MQENDDAIHVWSMTRDQVRTAGMSGEVYSLDHNAVWEFIDRYQKKKPTEVFEKVLRLFYHFLAKDRENRQDSPPT